MLAPRAHGRVVLVATGASADTAHGRVALVATGNGADAAATSAALPRAALPPTDDAAATSAALPSAALPRAALPPTDDAAATSAALPPTDGTALPRAALPQLPQRRHPSRNSVMTHLDNRAIMLYVTVVTGKRNAMLADKAVQDCIVAAWKAAADWLVGRYVIMPDHIHFFCAPATYPPPDFHRWMKQWKAQVSRSFPIGLRSGRAHGRVALVATGNGADAALPPTDDAAATSAALPMRRTLATEYTREGRACRDRDPGGCGTWEGRACRDRDPGGHGTWERPGPGGHGTREGRACRDREGIRPRQARPSRARPSRTRPPPEHGLPRAAGYLV